MKNLIGQKFNRLLVLEKTSQREGGSIVWKCKCDCGKECYASTRGLCSGNKKSCGCLNDEKRAERFKKYNDENRENIIGNKYGKLTVLEITDKTSKNGTHLYYKCKCECGNITYVTGNNLKIGNVISCGCIHSPDLTGQRFGKLVALEKTNQKTGNSYKWKCLCDCGNITYVSYNSLSMGHTKSCGCIISLGEAKITKILQDSQIEYTAQKTFADFKNENNICYRFDFYINGKIIEYDGIQHFKTKNSGWDTQEQFEKTQKNDYIKNKYCLDNHIPLYRIPYWELNNINTFKDLFQEKFLITSLKAEIESLGGKVTGSVSSKTDYLICNDKNSTTGKSADAKRLNIPIINEEDYEKMKNS